MTKELQNYVWPILPKEFKEEVKEIYDSGIKMMDIRPSASEIYANKLSTLEGIFGRHNLTSDAEGEEMLVVSRKRVQEVYAKNIAASNSDGHNSYDYGYYDGVINILFTLFGSKCRSDVEPKPAEPKYHKDDKVLYNGAVHKITVGYGDGRYLLNNAEKAVKESDLEPYTEPEEETSPNVNNSDIDIAELVAKGYVPDPAKQFDNILKGGFRDHNRLQIAAMAMQGLMCNPCGFTLDGEDQDKTPESIAEMAFLCADALIAECEKKGGEDERN